MINLDLIESVTRIIQDALKIKRKIAYEMAIQMIAVSQGARVAFLDDYCAVHEKEADILLERLAKVPLAINFLLLTYKSSLNPFLEFHASWLIHIMFILFI